MTETTEWFQPTSGRVLGVIAVVGAAVLVVLAGVDLREDHAPPVALGAAFVGALAWSAMLRPRVGLSSNALVLRNMVDTVTIPLAAVENLTVRQVLAVRAGGRRYVSPAIGKSLRKTLVSGRSDPSASAATVSYPDFVAERIRRGCDDARARLGVRTGSDETGQLAAQVRRDPAWPEIAALAVTGLGFVAALLAG